MNSRDFSQGVADGVFSFLADRPLSVVDPAITQISEYMAKAVTKWMDEHEDKILNGLDCSADLAQMDNELQALKDAVLAMLAVDGCDGVYDAIELLRTRGILKEMAQS